MRCGYDRDRELFVGDKYDGRVGLAVFRPLLFVMVSAALS